MIAGGMGSLGWLFVLSTPYLAGVASVGGVEIGGYRYTGWIWALILIASPVLLFMQKERPRFPVYLWAPWFLIVLLSLFWSESISAKNVQDACQIVTPLLVGVVTSAVVRSEAQLRRLRLGFTHALWIMVVCYALLFPIHPDWIMPRPMALTVCLCGAVFLGGLRRTPFLSTIGWLLCLIFAVVSGGRMATLALLGLWVIVPVYRRPVTPIAFAICMLVVGLGLLNLPYFQDRFFLDGGGSLGEILSGQIWGSGRFQAWPLIWERASERLVLGWGVGETSEYVPIVWPGVAQPHNDYLRIIFEQGFVGLAIFIVVALAQLAALWRRCRTSEGELQRMYAAAFLGLMIFLIVSFTENTLIYGVWYMHPLFALIGAAYGADKRTQPHLPRLRPAPLRAPVRAAVEVPSMARSTVVGSADRGAA